MSSGALPKISKRKARSDAAADGNDSDASSSSSGSDVSFINVDFDFRAPTEIDEAALRRLLRQLFHTHANSLNLYDVTSHILELGDAEKTKTPLGTVIKVEGDEDQDPFSFVSAVRLGRADQVASKTLTSYLSKHLPAASPIADVLTKAAAANAAEASRPYLYLHERFINLPPQTAPPLYRLLTDELNAATSASEDKQEPTHVLFLSRVFSAEAYSDDEDEPMTAVGPAGEDGQNDDDDDDDDDDEEDRPRGLQGAKRRKGLAGAKQVAAAAAAAARRRPAAAKGPRGERLAWGHFRPEDVILESHAVAQETFRFPPPQEAEESYESPLYARVLLLEWAKVKSGKIWDEMDSQLAAAAAAAAGAGAAAVNLL
ncbi:unnamed protein product [Parajaminaea phylloscopi]